MHGGPTGEFNTRVTYYKIRVYYLQIGRLANSGVFIVANLVVNGSFDFSFPCRKFKRPDIFRLVA